MLIKSNKKPLGTKVIKKRINNPYVQDVQEVETIQTEQKTETITIDDLMDSEQNTELSNKGETEITTNDDLMSSEPNTEASDNVEAETKVETTVEQLPSKEEPEQTVSAPSLEAKDERHTMVASEGASLPPVDNANHENPTTADVDSVEMSVNARDNIVFTNDTLLDDLVTIPANSHAERVINAPLTVVNHPNGKRIKLGKDVGQNLALQEGDTIEVFLKEQQVLICKAIGSNGHFIKESRIIYNKALVEAITNSCQLDFTNRSSVSLTQVKYVQSQGRTVAVIEM